MYFIIKVLMLCLVTFYATAAEPSSIRKVVAFGDSLSDVGNFFARTGFPPPPYFEGRASNGPVIVERVAEAYGVPLVCFAFFGATSGIGNFRDGGNATTLGSQGFPGMTTAYQSAISDGSLEVDNHALYWIWGGHIDVLTDGPSPATLTRSVQNLVAIVKDLQSRGAKRIVVVGLGDLGLTPLVSTLGPAAAAQVSAYVDAHNALLLASLPAGVTFFDANGLFRTIYTNYELLGFADATHQCLILDPYSICSNPDEYIWWDELHFTSAVAKIAADIAARCVHTRGGVHSAHCRMTPGSFVQRLLRKEE